MQSASDMFLGWAQATTGEHYYFRQLRDVRIKFKVDTFDASRMTGFAKACGNALARSHARSGEPALIAGYLGRSDVFDEAIVAFAVA